MQQDLGEEGFRNQEAKEHECGENREKTSKITKMQMQIYINIYKKN